MLSPSVCLSSVFVHLSVCITFVHLTQPVKIFGNFSSPFGTLVFFQENANSEVKQYRTTLAIRIDIHEKCYGDRSRGFLRQGVLFNI